MDNCLTGGSVKLRPDGSVKAPALTLVRRLIRFAARASRILT